MELGWIDFSKTERNKILSVLDLLSESGTLDELGIALVRDGFSNLFFSGYNDHPNESQIFLYCSVCFEVVGENYGNKSKSDFQSIGYYRKDLQTDIP